MDSPPHSSHKVHWLFLPLVLILSIFGGIVSHNVVDYLAPHQQRADWISRNAHLEARNALLERDFSDFLSSIGSSLESGVSKLLPNASSIMSELTSALSGSVDSLAEPAKFLGVGLSNGTLMGFNMSAPANMTAPSGIDNVAQNFGSGLSSTIFSSASIRSLLTIPPSSLGSSGSIGQAALALAQGLGGGASSSLKLTTLFSRAVGGTQPTVTFNTSGINGVAGNFGAGLSGSFVSGIQLPSLSSLMTTSKSILNSTGASLDFAAIGNGLGTGLGQGAAIGLGFQKDVASSPSQDAAAITQDFARGLVSSFLQNGTLSAIMSSLQASSANSSLLGSIDIAKAAEGVAVGLVSGVGSTVSTLQLIGANTSSFNDSVNGAATGFGRGLGSQGALLVQDLLKSPSSKTTGKRSLGETTRRFSIAESLGLRRRDSASTNATDLASVLANLNASAINPLLQTGVDDLQCEGIGGLVGVFLGLVESKTININSLTSTATNSSLNLPDQTFIIKSGGNTFTLNPAKGITTILVNGTSIVPFIGIAAAHIIFAILAYFIAIPVLMILINAQNLSTLLGSMHPAAPASKWQKFIAYSILPVGILTFAMGVALRGGSKHFTSAHEILGLIVFLQTLIAAGTSLLLQRQNLQLPAAKNLKLAHYGNIGLMLFLLLLTLLFGFTDLSSVSLCVTQAIIPTSGWMALGWLLLSPLVLALGLEALVFWLGWMRGKKAVGVRKEDIVKVQEKEEIARLPSYNRV